MILYKLACFQKQAQKVVDMKGGGERRDLFKRATVNRGTKEHPRVEWCCFHWSCH